MFFNDVAIYQWTKIVFAYANGLLAGQHQAIPEWKMTDCQLERYISVIFISKYEQEGNIS